MKLYDITQELFTSNVYKGDVPPTFIRQLKIKDGAPCNLTVLNMCAHNGTHIDAPYHFYDNGKTIEQMNLNKCIGKCSVVSFDTQPNLEQMENVLTSCEKRLLFKGNVIITIEIAKLLNNYHIELIGVESQSVGPVDAPMEVHLELLKEEVVLLEGIRLTDIPCGNYLLSAAPLKLGGSDGAPCRAVLIDINE
ncbi:MAG: cyclase family protein [Anaerocolumna sp.]|jgi:arylformamidase|nr:cyclase family protein [Anaerocolumna sp.]